MNIIHNFGVEYEDYFSNELSEVKDRNSYARFYLEVMRDFPMVVVQLSRNKPDVEEFAQKVLHKALRFQITKAVIAIAEEFPRYLIFKGSPQSAEYYMTVAEKHRAIYNAEIKVKLFSAEINLDFSRKVTSKKLLNKLNNYLPELDELALTNNTHNFEMYYFELLKKRAELLQDEDQILEICKRALVRMEKKAFNVTPQVLFAFSYPQIPILIKNGKYQEAKKIITKWSRILKKGTGNWFVIHSFYVILNFRMNNMDNVKALLQKVKEYPSDLIRERYDLFNAYSTLFDSRKNINLTRFINDVYEHQKDKGGYNIAVVIGKLMHQLKLNSDSSKSKYIESTEAIVRYMYRHVNDDIRSSLFLKMLLMIPKCDFDKTKFLDKSKDYLAELQKLPIEKHSRSVEVEMIPYEVLYKRVLVFLKN